MVLQDMHEIALRRYISPYHLALVNCSLGRAEETLDLLEQAHESRREESYGWPWILELDVLHGHPRFDELLAKLNHRLSAESATRDLSGRDQVSNSACSPATVNGNTTAAFANPTPQTLDNAKKEARQLYTAGRYYQRVARLMVFGRRSTDISMQLN